MTGELEKLNRKRTAQEAQMASAETWMRNAMARIIFKEMFGEEFWDGRLFTEQRERAYGAADKLIACWRSTLPIKPDGDRK